jgi:hypothetical protein
MRRGLLKSGEQELAQVPGNSGDYDLAQALLRSVRELHQAICGFVSVPPVV